jgi:two-component system OmpR family response regulator
MRLLLLEDDPTLGDALCGFLRLDGHLVDWHRQIRDAQAMADEPYDALIVDWQLPDGSGVDWVQRLRRQGVTAPILILTARDRLQDRIHGLDSGADDYLVKPFPLEELSARLRAVQRRLMAQGTPQLGLAGGVSLDLAGRFAWKGSRKIELTLREWKLIEALTARAGRVVSKSDLEALTQGIDVDTASNAIEVHVSNLRRKLGHEVIETVRGLGYRVPK